MRSPLLGIVGGFIFEQKKDISSEMSLCYELIKLTCIILVFYTAN
jgi:hypothetical protein